jgi:DNA topoisomerase-1
VDITDRRLARIVKQSQELPGYELFQYLDEEGVRRAVTSSDVNGYLQRISGQDFTAKDFRTWAGTVLAARALKNHECPAGSLRKARRNVASAIASVAIQLGNTKAVCRKCYVHPDIVQAYLNGTLLETLSRASQEGSSRSLPGLPPEEMAVLSFLRERITHANRPSDGAKRGT